MLMEILTASFTGDLSQALDQFEKLIKEYEQCCEEKFVCPHSGEGCDKWFDEPLKAGLVVANMADKSIQEHLLKDFARVDTFDKIKEEMLEE